MSWWLLTLYLAESVLAGALMKKMDLLKLSPHDGVNSLRCRQLSVVKDTDISSLPQCPHLACPPGWFLLQDTCFLRIQDSSSWEEGQSFCRHWAGSLATVSSVVNQEALSSILTEDNWIGLTYLHSNSKFVWADGSDYKYSRWAPKASSIPDIPGQYCVYMGQRDKFMWHTADCGERKRFLCSMKGIAVTDVCGALKNSKRSATTTTADPTTSTNTTTTTSSTTNLVPECPRGWIKFHSSCYKLFQVPLDYKKATKECKKLGNKLAIISSLEEHSFIKGLLNDTTYIGLDDMANEGTFIWQDGSPLEYSRFAKHQPDNRNNNEHCVEMRKEYAYYWNDLPCDTERHYICETLNIAAEKKTL